MLIDYKQVYDTVYQHSPIYGEDMDAATDRRAKDSIILSTIEVFAPRTLVDLGCGQGHYVRTSRQRMGVDAFGVEVSSACCEKYLQDVPHINLDAQCFLQLGLAYDFLLCTDVLEHIHPQEIDAILTGAAAASPVALYGIANHSDVQCGVELHTIQQPPAWWIQRLAPLYDEVTLVNRMYGGRFFFILCERRGERAVQTS